MEWDQWIDEQALASLLPLDQRHFAHPVKEALCVFLAGLSPARQTTVLTAQLALPPTATVSERLRALAQCCPVLQKLGQTLAREPRLDIELRHELQKLESLPPAVAWPEIESSLARELGPLAARGIQLDPPALAEASVAIVVPFSQTGQQAAGSVHQGVFKLLKPDIEAQLEEELKLLAQVGAHLDEECHALGLPHLDYEDAFEQVQQKLLCEIDLENEQQLLIEAGAFFADEPDVQIPARLEHCSPRVTAMERIEGGKLTDHPFETTAEREQFAAVVTRALISRPILAKQRRALFHGDPHAGNLFRTNDGRLAILDWSLAGHLDERARVAINHILAAAITLRRERICIELEALAERKQIDRPALRRVVANSLRKIRRGQFPGLRWLVDLLDEATHSARLRVAADLMLLRKSLLTIDGVLTELGANARHTDKVLVIDFLRQFGAEWPARWLATPTSRDFGTRLSNVDLTETMLHFPWAAARYWMDESCDMVHHLAGTTRIEQ